MFEDLDKAEMDQDWNEMTVAELKTKLVELGLSKVGTKRQLIERLEKHYEENDVETKDSSEAPHSSPSPPEISGHTSEASEKSSPEDFPKEPELKSVPKCLPKEDSGANETDTPCTSTKDDNNDKADSTVNTVKGNVLHQKSITKNDQSNTLGDAKITCDNSPDTDCQSQDFTTDFDANFTSASFSQFTEFASQGKELQLEETQIQIEQSNTAQMELNSEDKLFHPAKEKEPVKEEKLSPPVKSKDSFSEDQLFSAAKPKEPIEKDKSFPPEKLKETFLEDKLAPPIKQNYQVSDDKLSPEAKQEPVSVDKPSSSIKQKEAFTTDKLPTPSKQKVSVSEDKPTSPKPEQPGTDATNLEKSKENYESTSTDGTGTGTVDTAEEFRRLNDLRKYNIPDRRQLYHSWAEERLSTCFIFYPIYKEDVKRKEFLEILDKSTGFELKCLNNKKVGAGLFQFSTVTQRENAEKVLQTLSESHKNQGDADAECVNTIIGNHNLVNDFTDLARHKGLQFIHHFSVNRQSKFLLTACNIPEGTTEDDLAAHFPGVRMVHFYKPEGKQSGVGFLEFSTEDEVSSMMRWNQQIKIRDNPIVLRPYDATPAGSVNSSILKFQEKRKNLPAHLQPFVNIPLSPEDMLTRKKEADTIKILVREVNLTDEKRAEAKRLIDKMKIEIEDIYAARAEIKNELYGAKKLIATFKKIDGLKAALDRDLKHRKESGEHQDIEGYSSLEEEPKTAPNRGGLHNRGRGRGSFTQSKTPEKTGQPNEPEEKTGDSHSYRGGYRGAGRGDRGRFQHGGHRGGGGRGANNESAGYKWSHPKPPPPKGQYDDSKQEPYKQPGFHDRGGFRGRGRGRGWKGEHRGGRGGGRGRGGEGSAEPYYYNKGHDQEHPPEKYEYDAYEYRDKKPDNYSNEKEDYYSREPSPTKYEYDAYEYRDKTSDDSYKPRGRGGRGRGSKGRYYEKREGFYENRRGPSYEEFPPYEEPPPVYHEEIYTEDRGWHIPDGEIPEGVEIYSEQRGWHIPNPGHDQQRWNRHNTDDNRWQDEYYGHDNRWYDDGYSHGRGKDYGYDSWGRKKSWLSHKGKYGSKRFHDFDLSYSDSDSDSLSLSDTDSDSSGYQPPKRSKFDKGHKMPEKQGGKKGNPKKKSVDSDVILGKIHDALLNVNDRNSGRRSGYDQQPSQSVVQQHPPPPVPVPAASYPSPMVYNPPMPMPPVNRGPHPMSHPPPPVNHPPPQMNQPPPHMNQPPPPMYQPMPPAHAHPPPELPHPMHAPQQVGPPPPHGAPVRHNIPQQIPPPYAAPVPPVNTAPRYMGPNSIPPPSRVRKL